MTKIIMDNESTESDESESYEDKKDTTTTKAIATVLHVAPSTESKKTTTSRCAKKSKSVITKSKPVTGTSRINHE